MTTQVAYEMMRTYLGRPGARRAYDEELEVCRYETMLEGELHRCAVGCLFTADGLSERATIADPNIAEAVGVAPGTWEVREFEGGLAGLQIAGFELPEIADVDGSFLEGAQMIHDDICAWENGTLISKLDKLAERCGLTVVSDEAEGVPVASGNALALVG
jgi:hypothetical protein